MKKFNAGNAEVQIYSSQIALGAAAARRATSLICSAIEKRKRARIIVATGNSQISLANALVTEPIPWQAVDVFHMDEYVNIDANHPSSFRYWIRTRIEEKVSPGSVHYLNGDAPDLDSETRRYSGL
ncbi:MAG: 6-phosphogluconolactonase, partial [Acidobacteriaceae bacterium]|nr:6-phosphogluconolactonase [Acidobacteriaceae bacterium]